MRLLNNFLKLFLILSVLGGVFYLFQDKIPFFLTAPCAKPIPYNLGVFDKEFNITEKYFLEALAEAEAIWEKPIKKELFIYAPDNTSYNVLKINLIYDYRQQATSKLLGLGIVVKDTQASYDSLREKFEALKKDYEKQKNDLNIKIESFNQRNTAYEKDVNFWNKKGGAPEEEYFRLENERKILESEAKTLEGIQSQLNNMTEEINALVVVLNRIARNLNLSVDKYNTINETRGESFEEGLYESDGLKRQINIYEFSSHEKLVRVLAHELGHALDLDHIKDPKAIMYEFNQGDNMNLTPNDLAELSLKCKSK